MVCLLVRSITYPPISVSSVYNWATHAFLVTHLLFPFAHIYRALSPPPPPPPPRSLFLSLNSMARALDSDAKCQGRTT